MDSKNVLILFFGIFWSTCVNIVGRYRLFETHLFFEKNKRKFAIRRFLLGFLIIDIFPIIWLYLMYKIIPKNTDFLTILAACIASLSLFGFHRIIHSFVATDNFYQYFYSPQEWNEVLNSWRKGDPNSFLIHFIPGIIFLVLFPLIAYLIISFWN